MDITKLLADLSPAEVSEGYAHVHLYLKPDPNEPLIVGARKIAEALGVTHARFIKEHAERMQKIGLLYTMPIRHGIKPHHEYAAHRCGIMAYMIALTQLGCRL